MEEPVSHLPCQNIIETLLFPTDYRFPKWDGGDVGVRLGANLFPKMSKGDLLGVTFLFSKLCIIFGIIL